jgi:putative PIN family toxin of toxin-antitoxin system
MSLKVVYDTSVVVSAALKAYGTASTLLSLALTRQVTLYMSQPIFQEYREVLERPKFRLPIDTMALSQSLLTIPYIEMFERKKHY